METLVTSIPFSHYCVVTAADIEFNAVTRQLQERTVEEVDHVKICRGRIGRNVVTVLRANIGGVDFHSHFVALLQERRFDMVLVLGLAGGLHPELKTGTLVFYDTCFLFRPEIVSADDSSINGNDRATHCDFALATRLCETLNAQGWPAVFGAGLTMDFMATTAVEKISIGETSGAAAVDMESYEIVNTAMDHGIPAVVLRVILDEAGQTTPDFNPAIEPDGRLNNIRSFFAMLARPKASVIFFVSLLRSLYVLRRAARLVLNAAPEWRSRALVRLS